VSVAIEATYGWYWAVDALLAAGFEVHLTHPLGMKALRKRKRVKTDPRDVYELANLLRRGSLPEAYISPPDLQELRELVRHRRQLLKQHNIRLAATDLDTSRARLGSARSPNVYPRLHRVDLGLIPLPVGWAAPSVLAGAAVLRRRRVRAGAGHGEEPCDFAHCSRSSRLRSP
jgi:hypothetical protein